MPILVAITSNRLDMVKLEDLLFGDRQRFYRIGERGLYFVHSAYKISFFTRL